MTFLWQVSCSGFCYKNDATLCPSRNCSNCSDTSGFDAQTIQSNNRTLGSKMRSIWTLSGSSLKYCTNARHDCMVTKHVECCAHPGCEPPKSCRAEQSRHCKKRTKVFFDFCKLRFFSGEQRNFTLAKTNFTLDP